MIAAKGHTPADFASILERLYYSRATRNLFVTEAGHTKGGKKKGMTVIARARGKGKGQGNMGKIKRVDCRWLLAGGFVFGLDILTANPCARFTNGQNASFVLGRPSFTSMAPRAQQDGWEDRE